MYDPVETELSYSYLSKLQEGCKELRWALLGGWAVYLQVQDNYQRAFGKEYLRSRDIDLYIDAVDQTKLAEVIRKLEFIPSAYHFRYELIYAREEKRILSIEEAKQKPIFNLIYLFLDIFSDRETKAVGSWVFPELKTTEREFILEMPVLSVSSLLNLKTNAFFQREKLDKELKDACDIYALLFYSNTKAVITIPLRKAIEKIITRVDVQKFIAEQVLGDSLKSDLVLYSLRGLA